MKTDPSTAVLGLVPVPPHQAGSIDADQNAAPVPPRLAPTNVSSRLLQRLITVLSFFGL
jgi:hypothetical protein